MTACTYALTTQALVNRMHSCLLVFSVSMEFRGPRDLSVVRPKEANAKKLRTTPKEERRQPGSLVSSSITTVSFHHAAPASTCCGRGLHGCGCVAVVGRMV